MRISDYTKQQIISLLEILYVDFDKNQSKTKLFDLLKSNEKKLEEIRLGTYKPIENRPFIELDQLNIDIEKVPTHVSIGFFDEKNTNLSGFIDTTKEFDRIYKEDGSFVKLSNPYCFYFKHRYLNVENNIVNLKVSDLYPHLQFHYGTSNEVFNCCAFLLINNKSNHTITDIRLDGVPLTAKLDLSEMLMSVDYDNLGSIPLKKVTNRADKSVTGFGNFLFPHKLQSYAILNIYSGLKKFSIPLKSITEFGRNIIEVTITDSLFDSGFESAISYDISPDLIRCSELKCICPEWSSENNEDGSIFDDEIDLDDKFCGRLNLTYPRDRKKQIDKVVTRGESFIGADTVRRRDGSWEQCPPRDIQTYTEQKFDDDGSFLQRTNFASVDDDGNYDWFECHPKDYSEATPLKYNIPDSMEKEIENKRNLIDELIALRSKGNPNERKMPFDDELARRRGERVTNDSFETALAKRQAKHRL